jgi:DNA (cytosine-5)-methyltransferase 1
MTMCFEGDAIPTAPVSGSRPAGTEKLRVLDLFAGACGGWSTGLHRTGGFVTVAACEIDPWRRAQFASNFPEARLYDDVRTLTADRLRADGAFPDIIVGSPPCQDASSANHKGRGVDGERTGLFFEWVRLVAECRPRWACAENVPGIRNRGVDRVLGAMEAISYACWPLVVGAVDLGANHRRKRLVLVAADLTIAADTDPNAIRIEPGRRGGTDGQGSAVALVHGAHAHGEGQHARAGDAREMARSPGDDGIARLGGAASYADERRLGPEQARAIRARRLELGAGEDAEGRAFDAPRHHWAASAPDFGRMDDGLSDKVARACISAYGDSFAPQKAELIGRWILHAEASSLRVAA